MIKSDEIEHPESCFNKARDNERLFILLARDPAAPAAIRAWVAERIRLGKNTPADPQIRAAIEGADLMDVERAGIESARQQQLRWADHEEAPIAIARFSSMRDAPSREVLSWGKFVALFSDPIRSSCALATCQRSTCAGKRGPCWSPALYGGASRGRGNVEVISLLVFDVERTTDDQLYEIRARLGGHRYLVHSTHSDRPGSRFTRVIVALSRPVARDAWPMFWRTMQQALAPVADPACSDAGRIYFLPTAPQDGGYFVQVNDGAPLDVDGILAAAPAAVDYEARRAVGGVSP